MLMAVGAFGAPSSCGTQRERRTRGANSGWCLWTVALRLHQVPEPDHQHSQHIEFTASLYYSTLYIITLSNT